MKLRTLVVLALWIALPLSAGAAGEKDRSLFVPLVN